MGDLYINLPNQPKFKSGKITYSAENNVPKAFQQFINQFTI